MHYTRWKKHGDPTVTKLNRPRKPRGTCSLCERPHYAKGLCNVHYMRQWTHGDPNAMLKPYGMDAYISTDGYRFVLTDGGYVAEHRLVMEQALGRPLGVDEVVHHINHDRLDNRRENLEVLTRSEHTRLHHGDGDTFQNRPLVHDQRPCLVCGKVPTKARSLCGAHHSAWLRGYITVEGVPPAWQRD